MARSINKVIIIGNLGKDAEMKFTPSGREVTTFSVACNRQYRNGSGEEVKETEWINVEAWSALAKILNNCRKGERIYIEGRLKTDRYEAQDGQAKYFVKVVAQEFMFLSGRNAGERTSDPEAASDAVADLELDDIEI